MHQFISRHLTSRQAQMNDHFLLIYYIINAIDRILNVHKDSRLSQEENKLSQNLKLLVKKVKDIEKNMKDKKITGKAYQDPLPQPF